jgi:hypothetical protein
MAGSKRLCPMARHALGVAPPRAVRARLVMRLGGHSAIHREEARLVAAAHEYRTKAVLDRGLVRAQLLDERVAPGGGVGVEVLEGERVGPKARADAQVGARDHPVGRAVLARDVLDQAPTGSTRHYLVDARVLGPGHHGSSSSSRGSGHSDRGLVGVNPQRAAICRRFPKTCRKAIVPYLTSC